MDNTIAEKRRSPRVLCSGIVTLKIQEGVDRGATYSALLHDRSNGGVCVILDGGVFPRGTAVVLELDENLSRPAWVCHSQKTAEWCRVGLSFVPVESIPEKCWEPELCQNANSLVEVTGD